MKHCQCLGYFNVTKQNKLPCFIDRLFIFWFCFVNFCNFEEYISNINRGNLSFSVQHLMFMKQVSWITINYSWYQICLHGVHSSITCCENTNMKCFNFLPICSCNHVELMVTRKEPFLDTFNSWFCSYNWHIKCNKNWDIFENCF